MRNILLQVIIALATCVAATGCGKKSSADRTTATGNTTETPATELPLPAVPDSLQTVEARAAYVARHFWDEMDFGSAQATDTAFVEQNFANYTTILPIAPPDSAQAAVDELLHRAAANPGALSLLVTTADDYLDHPNSPMRNEETYILFLKTITGGGYLSEEKRMRYVARLEDAMKNRPGYVAADFGVDLRGGGRSSLHKIAAKAETTLLIFYDPDCPECHQIMNELAGIQLPHGWQIAAVDSETDRGRWEATCGKLPALWTVAYPADATKLSELYPLTASPTLYLIDHDGTVMLKDASPETIAAVMQQEQRQP